MSSDQTIPQSGEQQQRTRDLSRQRQRPPTDVPGYEPHRFLGAGAYGEVWVAGDRNTGRTVAIKFYTHRRGLDWSLLSREVEKLQFLFGDRYVVQLIRVGWDADPPFYIMEYVEHGSLDDRLSEVGPLPVGEAVELFREIAIGLAHAHGKGVLHCDLKPGNILLDLDGRPRLADFGQSRLSHEQSPALGTLFYMAPEQADLQAIPDARWDVYALGAIIHCMLTGRPPHRDENVASELETAKDLTSRLERYRQAIKESPIPTAHRRIPGVDRALADIIDGCLAVKPGSRFPNVQALLDALESRQRQRQRRPLLVMGAVGPALLMLIISLFAWSAFRTAREQSIQALSGRVVENVEFAARLGSSAVARQIDLRWRILSQAGDDEEFRRVHQLAAAHPLGSQERAALQERVRRLFSQHREATEATSWFVQDRNGRQLARFPYNEATIDKNYAYRDYFHGQGRDFPPGSTGYAPIRQVHLSRDFVSQATKKRMVAFGVPIWPVDGEPGDPTLDPIGVLAMTVHLGTFFELMLEREDEMNRVVVLIDTRDEGRILNHPYQTQLVERALADASVVLPKIPALGSETLARLTSTHQYRDPLGKLDSLYGGDWLASLEPVKIPGRTQEVGDTHWAVLVQERYSAVVEPVRALAGGLLIRGLGALVFVLGVVTVLWGFVIRAMRDPGRTGFTGAFAGGSGTSSGAGVRTPSAGRASSPAIPSTPAHTPTAPEPKDVRDDGPKSGGPTA